MRHRCQFLKLGRTSSHRLALMRNMAQSLFENGQITTTLPRAKNLRPFVERLITLARRAHNGDLNARRRIIRLLNDRASIPAEHRSDYEDMPDSKRARVLRARSGRRHRTGAARAGLPFTAQSVVYRLINEIAPRFEDRPGGYTRIIRLARRRIGDAGQLAVLQLLGEEQSPGTVTRPKRTTRSRKAESRYAFAARVLKKSRTQPPAPPRDTAEPTAPAGESHAPADTPADQPSADSRPDST